jgi:2-polyprenyl-6-methoxyphenol hydroxylase-like FAD-dependent oxidoreductase
LQEVRFRGSIIAVRKALVIGAGIGGLAAAVALRRAGRDVEIFERARTSGELGFALLLAPNAATALRRLGFFEEVATRAVLVEHAEIRRADGSVLRRLDLRVVHEKLGAPTFAVLRTALHGTLLGAVDPRALHLGRRAVGFEATERGVTLELEDGSAHSGGILIGADGVGSVVRAKLHPTEPPRAGADSSHFGGSAAWARSSRRIACRRFTTAGASRQESRAFGPNEVYWFVGARLPGLQDLRGVDSRALVVPFRDQLHEPFRRMIDETAEGDLRLDALLERPPLSRWARLVPPRSFVSRGGTRHSVPSRADSRPRCATQRSAGYPSSSS